MSPLLSFTNPVTVVVVRDAKQIAKRFADILGIGTWQVRIVAPERLELADLTREGVSYLVASAQTSSGCARFELVQPISGEDSYAQFLLENGEGVASIRISCPGDVEARIEALAAADVAVRQRVFHNGLPARTQLDTREKVGGFYVEFDEQTPAVFDEVWTFKTDDAVFRMEVLEHYGVVVDDVEAAARALHELFGLAAWSFVHWDTRIPGRLSDATFQGKPVKHGYFTASHIDAKFGFELIQVTHGPSDYGRFFAQRGAGVHHLSILPNLPPATWKTTVEELRRRGILVNMNGLLIDGAADYQYLDTTVALGGWVAEAWHQLRDDADWSSAREYTLDFQGDRSA